MAGFFFIYCPIPKLTQQIPNRKKLKLSLENTIAKTYENCLTSRLRRIYNIV
jgi:hypothetical protein